MRWRQAKKLFKKRSYIDDGFQLRFAGLSSSISHRHWKKIERPHGPRLRATGKTYRAMERVASAVARCDHVVFVAASQAHAAGLSRRLVPTLPRAFREPKRSATLYGGPVFVVSKHRLDSEMVYRNLRRSVVIYDHYALGL